MALYGMEKKKSGEYTGSTPAFSATHHASQKEVQVCTLITHSRVWINRVRSPVLLVVNWTGKINISPSSFAPENLVSRDRVVPGTRYHIWYQFIILLSLSTCPLHTNSGCGIGEAHINWSMVTCQGSTRSELP